MLPTVRKILYPTDLSPTAPAVFRYAMGLAHQCDASLVVLHSLEPPTPYAQHYLETMLPEETRTDTKRAAHERILQTVRERLGAFCDKEVCTTPAGADRVTDILVREGHPVEVILEEAEKTGADLIVMGAHGRGLIGEVLLGSVTHRVIQRATLPVLIARLPKELPDG